MTPTLGVVRPGSTFEGMIERHGDYDAWFARALEPTGVRVVVHDAMRHAPPAPGAADGWIVTGSRASLTDPEPWTGRLLEWMRAAVEAGAPLLGVCYGHQALCAAFGGRVERHAEGWEIGTAEVELTDTGARDPLFRDFPARFLVQTTHEDHVTVAPPDATVLASNPHTPVQAVAVGRSARGVQFHPEVTAEISRDFVERRRHLLAAPPRVEDAPLARAVLANFVDGFVR